ncbi:Phenylacetone monooxygenase [Pyrenophora tritici-repentis]|uniref:Phenylacetone monooxygenase n=3 Tax=Pyrenophora tritici-repentis TaxID=45151 RepID=A0A2W1E2M8_9PLEO|nr:Phenylacetone monooxygenase [Pyrenophora tritici-repentis]KAF7449284.1 Phenylacetone monooxygenase [Pyrenophora tritici-repentis]KAI0570970.1 Phenylacetone monooxygenase [Pyrenophora tritici-repentis]KAI0573113.1 Phenylacetone monooxygenase [Pyrenophora tritici-repentis]KAI0605356.1 Phenylacetone monooxygenase [Pyrenophora tritici-repentis]
MNRCACDVPSHNYTWSFEPKTDWSANYATSEEIYDYFKSFSDKYGLEKFIKFRHQVIGARWDEQEALWHVTVQDLATGNTIERTAQILINAGGILNSWRFPPIPGINSFKGPLVHSAAWPKFGLELTGKTVGLIGNGSSGIQILPAIKDRVGKLVTFIREGTWVAPPLGGEYKAYSKEDKENFAADKETEAQSNSMFGIFHQGSQQQKSLQQYMNGLMKQKLGNPQLEKVLIPKWAVGCRRLTPGTNYLESLNDPKVQTVYGEITNITPTGVICDDGKGEYPVDVLICATGFDTTFKPRFSVDGARGAKLQDMWKDEPQAYLGIAVDHCPNYMFTLGPNCPIGNGPVLISIEAEVEYMIKILSKFQKENISAFEVRSDAVEDFNQWTATWMKDTIWAEPCRSWYKAGSASGKILALWPGSTLHYLEALREPRWEDWIFTRPSGSNRFQYLGNGHSTAEANGGDLAYYIRNHDDSYIDPSLKRVHCPSLG